MYYVEIMENAARIGPEALAEAMMAALEACDENPDYTGMKCVALAILLEQLAVQMNRGGDTRPVCREIRRRSKSLLKLEGLPDKTRDYAVQALDCIDHLDDEGIAGKIIRLSRQIAY